MTFIKTTKRYYYITLLLTLALTTNANEQEEWDSISKNATMNLFYESGYISAFGGVGNIEPLIFEANIIPYYTMGIDRIKKWDLLLSPQVILRMYNSDSWPIRTPSYMPRVILTHQFVNHEKRRDWFGYISWFHHSNGQDGEFFLPDSSGVNTRDGSFSTNWIEGGVYFSRFKDEIHKHQYYLKLNAQHCYQQDEHQNGIYGRTRFYANLISQWNLSKTLMPLNEKYFEKHDILLTFDLLLGVITDKLDNEAYLESDRFMLKYTLSVKPGFLRDVRLFAQYYYGPDYYNIYFYRNLHVLRFGIIAKSFYFD